MKLKKVIALLLASVMSVSILAACGSDSTTDDPVPSVQSLSTEAPATVVEAPTENKSEGQLLAEQYGLPYTPLSEGEPITFTYFIRNPGTPPAATNRQLEIFEKITNTKIEFEFLVGDLETKISVMLASGDWSDIAFFGGEARPFIDSGLALPLSDYITQYAPNLRSHYEPWWELMKHSDGNVYIAEIYSTPVGAQYVNEIWGSAFWMQKAVLDHFGRAPETLDEYFDFIREYKELYPTIDGVPTIGFEVQTEGWRRFCRDNPPMFLQGYGNWGPAMPDNQFAFDSVSTVSSRWTNDWNKTYYQKLNDEFHKGTISAESLTRSNDDYLAALASGAVLGTFDQLWAFNSGLDPLRAEDRHERTYLPLDFTYDGITPHYVDSRQFTGNNGIIVNNSLSEDKVIRLMQYLDYLIQEDVQRFLRWGIEGENWFFNSEGRMERSQEQRDFQVEVTWLNDNLGRQLWDLMPKMLGSYSDGNATEPSDQPEEYLAGLVEYDKTLFAKLGIKTQTGLLKSEPMQWPVYYPYWSMTWDDGSPANLADTRINDTNDRHLSRIIISPADQLDSLWDEYVKAINDTGEEHLHETIEEISQTRFDAVHN